MERKTTVRLCALVIVASLSTLGACSSDSGSKTATPVPPAIPATEQPATVIGEAYAETEAVIQAVDLKTRNVTLRMADGTTRVVQVPPDVDLSKRRKGDVVILEAFQRLSVRALPPGSAPLGITREAAMAKAAPGQTPGRAVAEVTSVVSEVAAVDVVNNTVTLRGADGSLRTLNVTNPENQQKLKTLKAGDLVQIDLVEAGAVRLKSKA